MSALNPSVGAAPTPETCNVCLEEFNKSLRVKIACPFCNAGTCRQCFQTYLLTLPEEPFCLHPQCGRPLSTDFVNSVTSAAFRNGAYKIHKGKLMTDLERARLPETQTNAERVREAADAKEKDTQEHEENARKLRQLMQRQSILEDRITAANSTEQNYGRRPMAQYMRGHRTRRGESEESSTQRHDFVCPCPGDDCRGFLTTQWNCPLCTAMVCKDCHEIISYKNPRRAQPKPQKSGEENQQRESDGGAGSATSEDEQPSMDAVQAAAEAAQAEQLTLTERKNAHQCDPNKVANIQFLKQSSKPCPKCGCPISKIDGCDQMWCTQCNTAFSWTSGNIVTGRVHNPHYFEWLRRTGNNAALAADAAGAGGAGAANPCDPAGQRLPYWNIYHYALSAVFPARPSTVFLPSQLSQNVYLKGAVLHKRFEIRYQTLNDAQDEIENLRAKERRILPNQAEGFLHLRVLFLLGRLSSEEFEQNIRSAQTSLARFRGRSQIIQTFVQIGGDLIRQLPTNVTDPGSRAIKIRLADGSLSVPFNEPMSAYRLLTMQFTERVFDECMRIDTEFDALLEFTNAALERHNRHTSSHSKLLDWSRKLPSLDNIESIESSSSSSETVQRARR